MKYSKKLIEDKELTSREYEATFGVSRTLPEIIDRYPRRINRPAMFRPVAKQAKLNANTPKH